MFYNWMFAKDPHPYYSFGNGAAMRVSPCGFAARSESEAILLSRKVTEISHDHPEGIKGAEATSVAIFMARDEASKNEIRKRMSRYYDLNFTLDGIRNKYKFNETCQGTVPQAIVAFLESTSFEDAIRGAISIGGDSDTMAAITGGIAEAYYGVSDDKRKRALDYLTADLKGIYEEWEGFMRKTQ
jgi:ADP-ribosylglycohydrolase